MFILLIALTMLCAQAAENPGEAVSDYSTPEELMPDLAVTLDGRTLGTAAEKLQNALTATNDTITSEVLGCAQELTQLVETYQMNHVLTGNQTDADQLDAATHALTLFIKAAKEIRQK